jgi:hypothetical protein
MAEAVLVANRFVELSDATYLDLASNSTVALTRCTASDAVRVTLADEGARLCRLWHPVLAPYMDFGPLGECDWFEAVATVPMSVTPVTAGRADVEAFLHAHDLRSVSLEESSLEILQPSLLAPRSPTPPSTEASGTIRGFGTRLIEPQIFSTLMC